MRASRSLLLGLGVLLVALPARAKTEDAVITPAVQVNAAAWFGVGHSVLEWRSVRKAGDYGAFGPEVRAAVQGLFDTWAEAGRRSSHDSGEYQGDARAGSGNVMRLGAGDELVGVLKASRPVEGRSEANLTWFNAAGRIGGWHDVTFNPQTGHVKSLVKTGRGAGTGIEGQLMPKLFGKIARAMTRELAHGRATYTLRLGAGGSLGIPVPARYGRRVFEAAEQAAKAK
ncbi:MAG: hypothetical protein IT371_04190 [Deltaproteobacteria bacterium]|nr:hypothetical protein [Deltaproteobacteria bacterium]